MAKILIIEDDELIRRMYQQIFSFRGHEVTVAANGEEGIEQARTQKPTLILLDIMMPKLNGLDMLKQIKAMPELAKIPVIVLTNLMGAADAEAALSAGAVKYIIKSDYVPKEVEEVVEGILAGYTRNDIPEVKSSK
jgi:CheY-like chemotaxis protein